VFHNINKGRAAISYGKETPEISTIHQLIISSVFLRDHSLKFIKKKKDQVIIPRTKRDVFLRQSSNT